MGDFRFSCNVFAVRSREQFAQYCRDAERYGYAAVFTADHLGSPSPSRRWCWRPRSPNGCGWESSCITVREPYMAAFAPVIERLS